MAIAREFVIGDIHGAYKALLQCLERVGFNYENDRLIQIGDVVDGFPEAYECIEELLRIKHLIPLKGNHDQWFLEFLEIDLHPMFWNFGGKGTLISYLRNCQPGGRYFTSGSGFKTSLEPTNIPVHHKDFFRQQQLYYVNDRHQCFVHAGFKLGIPFYEQKSEDYYWDRDLWQDAVKLQADGRPDEMKIKEFVEVFIGHTSTTRSETDQPIQISNIINLDTGAGHSGRLTIMDIRTKEFWQSDPVTELYRENFRK